MILEETQATVSRRNENIDFLRAIGCIAVVLLHVNAWCFEIEKLSIGIKTENVLINTLVRFAVPCFMLITGTYIFRNADELGWKNFYKKAIEKLLFPTLYFSLLYVIYTVFKGFLQREFLVEEALIKWMHGIPFGHMWYMYMLIGFYIATPFLCQIRSKLGRKAWAFLGIFCILTSAVNFNGSLIAPNWILCWIQYVGYFIIGDVCGGQKSKKIAKYAWTGCGLSIVSMFSYSLYVAGQGIRYDFQPQNILTAVFSISIYLIVYNSKTIHLTKRLRLIARQSSSIYYIHGLVINMVVIAMNRFELQYKWPICFTIVTFNFALLCSYFYGIIHSRCVHFIRKSRNTE